MKPGLLLCTSLAAVELAFENWRRSYDLHEPEKLAEGCTRIPAGYAASIAYLRAFRKQQHWDADLLKFHVLRQASPGLLIFDDVYYGHGSATPRQATFPALPRPQYQ